MYQVSVFKLGGMMRGLGVGRSPEGAALTAYKLMLFHNAGEITVPEQHGALWLTMRVPRLGQIPKGAPPKSIEHKASGMRLELMRLTVEDFHAKFIKQERSWQAMDG